MISVAPNIVSCPEIQRTLLPSSRRSDMHLLVKMIIGDREGQTNKPDTLIGERDGSFVLSTHHRLPRRVKGAGSREYGRSDHSDDLSTSLSSLRCGSVRIPRRGHPRSHGDHSTYPRPRFSRRRAHPPTSSPSVPPRSPVDPILVSLVRQRHRHATIESRSAPLRVHAPVAISPLIKNSFVQRTLPL